MALAAITVAGLGVGAAIAGNKGETKKENWSVIDRNTIGSPVAALRDGPSAALGGGQVTAPPFGKGSLGIEVSNPTNPSVTSSTEKVAFGNQVDFYGDLVSGLDQAGFYVFQTGEDRGYGGPGNLPYIQFEIAAPDHGVAYSSMVWVPNGNGVTANVWSGYIDATNPANGYWYFTASGLSTCNAAAQCSLAAAQAAAGPNAVIGTTAVGKGRDNQFQGAVDGLRINDKIYDFEADGVKHKGAK